MTSDCSSNIIPCYNTKRNLQLQGFRKTILQADNSHQTPVLVSICTAVLLMGTHSLYQGVTHIFGCQECCQEIAMVCNKEYPREKMTPPSWVSLNFFFLCKMFFLHIFLFFRFCSFRFHQTGLIISLDTMSYKKSCITVQINK